MRIHALIIMALASALWTNSSVAQDRFLPIEGASLTARMEAAKARARTDTPQSRFWTAYGFDVRPGIAVDIETINTNGTTNSIGMMTGGGLETRNLAVFVLREPDSGSVARLEVYNLNRPRNYSGYPVYWTGQAGPEESLAYLASITESDVSLSLMERSVMAIGLHDDPQALLILERIIRTSQRPQVRTAAVSWLGHYDADPGFFAALVRDENELLSVRSRAVSALASAHDQEALATLQALYGEVRNRDIKKRVVSSLSHDDFGDGAVSFLSRIAADRNEDYDVRRQAINGLSHRGGDAIFGTLLGMYRVEQQTDFKSRLIEAMARTDHGRVEDVLTGIAKSDDPQKLRVRAMRLLVDRNPVQAVSILTGLYDTERNIQMRLEILDMLGQSYHTAATQKLITVAQSDEPMQLRKKAIHWLGKSSDPLAMDYIEGMLK